MERSLVDFVKKTFVMSIFGDPPLLSSVRQYHGRVSMHKTIIFFLMNDLIGNVRLNCLSGLLY